MSIERIASDIKNGLSARSLYLFGSVARKDQKPLSDIDLIICFDKIDDSFLKEIQGFFSGLSRKYFKRVDARVMDLSNPKPMPYENKTAKLMFGEDVIARLPYESFEEYKMRNFNISCTIIAKLHHLAGNTLSCPLSYPDRNAKYFGFIENSNARLLLSANLYIARFLLAYLKNIQTLNKRENIRLYKSLMHDEWAQHVEAAFLLLSEKYQYQIEGELKTQDYFLLKKICRHTLQFENYFLGLAKDFYQGQ